MQFTSQNSARDFCDLKAHYFFFDVFGDFNDFLVNFCVIFFNNFTVICDFWCFLFVIFCDFVIFVCTFVLWFQGRCTTKNQ